MYATHTSRHNRNKTFQHISNPRFVRFYVLRMKIKDVNSQLQKNHAVIFQQITYNHLHTNTHLKICIITCITPKYLT